MRKKTVTPNTACRAATSHLSLLRLLQVSGLVSDVFPRLRTQFGLKKHQQKKKQSMLKIFPNNHPRDFSSGRNVTLLFILLPEILSLHFSKHTTASEMLLAPQTSLLIEKGRVCAPSLTPITPSAMSRFVHMDTPSIFSMLCAVSKFRVSSGESVC